MFKLIDPFLSEKEYFTYEDISNIFIPFGSYLEVVFDALVEKSSFLNGQYSILLIDGVKRNILSETPLNPKIFIQDEDPTESDILFHPEMNRSSFYIHPKYNDSIKYIIKVKYESLGIAMFGKSSYICTQDDLMSRLSFRQMGTVSSYTHLVCDGREYDANIYSKFYKKFKNRYGGTLDNPRVPNLIGLFPRNIGYSSGEYAQYFKDDNPGKKYIQRIPKIKLVNALIGNHQHTTYRNHWGNESCNYSSRGNTNMSNQSSTMAATYNVVLSENRWGSVQTGTGVDLNNFEFTDKYEPRSLDVVPFIRMV